MRYACVYLVLSATDQAKAVGELTQHVRETTSEVGEQEVGETTVNPTEDTEGACIWLTSALIGKLSELRDNLKLMCVIQCFFFPRLTNSFYTITCPRSPITSSLSHCKLVIVHNRLQRVKRIYEIILQLLKKETHLLTNIVVTVLFFKER